MLCRNVTATLKLLRAALTISLCFLQAAHISAELERYPPAIEAFEAAAKAAVDNNLLKYSAKGYLLNAGICQLCSECSRALRAGMCKRGGSSCTGRACQNGQEHQPACCTQACTASLQPSSPHYFCPTDFWVLFLSVQADWTLAWRAAWGTGVPGRQLATTAAPVS